MTGQNQRTLAEHYFKTTAPRRWEMFYLDQDKQCIVYDLIYRERMRLALSLAEQLGLPKRATCLDIGCGPGYGSVALAQRGFAVHALDLIEAQIIRTKERAEEAGVTVNGSVGNIHNLDFPDAKL